MTLDPPAFAPQRNFTVEAPGRLHLGFLDPAGTLGRRFGSLGLVIEGFQTEVEIIAAPAEAAGSEVVAAGPGAEAEVRRAADWLRALQQHTARHDPIQVRLLQVLPVHAGFGSGTQLALAIGRAFSLWHGLAPSTATLAHWLGRGLRSGVGIAGFDQGGLLLDGGPGASGTPAPMLARIELPEAWRIVVAMDPTLRGLSGQEERQAIAGLLPLPQAAAADICHQVLMRVLPGAADGDFASFAAGISRIQDVLGGHFAAAQAGNAYTSPSVGTLMRWIAADSASASGAAVGQSSWGPTGFAILPTQAEADRALDRARVAGVVDPALSLRIVRARNRGAAVVDHGMHTAAAASAAAGASSSTRH